MRIETNRIQKLVGLLVLSGILSAWLVLLHNASLYHSGYEPLDLSKIYEIEAIQARYNPLIVSLSVVGVLGTGLALIQYKQRKNTVIAISFLHPLLNVICLWLPALLLSVLPQQEWVAVLMIVPPALLSLVGLVFLPFYIAILLLSAVFRPN